MSNFQHLNDVAARVAREERAAAEAKCEKSRRAHLGLAERYQQKLDQMNAAMASSRTSFG